MRWVSGGGTFGVAFVSGRRVARLAGLEPTASSSAGMRSIHLSYKRVSPKPTTVKIGPFSGVLLSYWLVPKEGLEPTRPFRALHPECSASTNSATSACSRCLPDSSDPCSPEWWAVEGSNLGPLACEASALTTELTARLLASRPIRPFSVSGRPIRSFRWWQRLDSNQ